MNAKEYSEKHAKDEGAVMQLRLEQAYRAGWKERGEKDLHIVLREYSLQMTAREIRARDGDQ